MKPILAILGATGVGKSAVGVEVAKIFVSSVISCDSMQIYKGLDIGTSKITVSERWGVKHYMLDVVEPTEAFSAYDYQQMVACDIFPIFEKTSSVPIVVGGTGFYFDSLIYGLDLPNQQDSKLRQELTSLLNEKGLPHLLELLKEKDIESYAKIDKNNAKRVIRALEIAQSGGSRFANADIRTARFETFTCILNRSREIIYQNIDKRVDKMVESGLFDEVEELYKRSNQNRNLQCLEAIGYKEIIDYFEGLCSAEEAIAKVKLNTRHYAKRQLTYFKRMDGHYVDVDDFDTVKDLSEHIAELYQNFAKN